MRTRHFEVRGSAIRMYCSEACQYREDTGTEDELAPRRSARIAGALIVPSLLAGGLTLFGVWSGEGGPGKGPIETSESQRSRAMGPPAPAADETLPRHGPAWPPTEEERIEMLADDAWIHPLRGPERRMPIRASRAFGAPRPGHRPLECKAGHCGVDLGGQHWGEPVLAVQDGVVERIERSPNGNGGRYVWLSHREGSVYTHYFHLAAIPPELEAGDRVSRGQNIGLLGGSGVEHSGPHLHFTVAVDLPGDKSRQYIDPEPLLAFWPLEVPLSCEAETRVSTAAPPGEIIGSHPRYGAARAPRRVARNEGDATGKDEDAAAAARADTGKKEGVEVGAADDEGPIQPISGLPSLGEDASEKESERGAEAGTLPGFASP